ncbi:MAG TPA: TonB-dependent receptor, partial [Thauera sp.]|nr:TonB-dependent receptor [Thauera sp.]
MTNTTPPSIAPPQRASATTQRGCAVVPGGRLRRALLLAVLASAAARLDARDLEELLTTPVPRPSPFEVIKAEPVVGAAKYEQRQSEVAAAATVISREEIRSFGWRTLDEALATLPGVFKTYDRQYSYLGVRGFGLPGDYMTRVLLTIDGVRANEPLYDSAPLGRTFPLDLDLVERIEFIPGPGGALYGQNAM